ncbi:hypothetical protein ACLKA7_010485 [Drosophila subpalustris]
MHLPDFTAALLLALVVGSSAQRVAPGVNPQHYQQVPQQVPQHHQQPPPPQQYQQHHGAPGVPPQQYQQQQQVQYQQVPVQQQQHPPQMQHQPQMQQQQHMQPPVQQQQQQHPQQVQHHPQQQQAGGHGHHHGQPQQVLNTGNIQQERAHIQEHMQVPIDTSKMSEAELQFHYFKMHDSDNNNKLDGCELIKSLIHWHVEDPKKPHAEDNAEKVAESEHKGNVYTDKALEETIDYPQESKVFAMATIQSSGSRPRERLLYAFRGWIAFVAFMDLGTAFRSYIERRSFLGDHSDTQFIEGDYTISRIIGMYCLLKAIALVHCTLYIHYRPVVSMGGCSLALTMVFYATEALYFRSSTLNFYVIFPCVLNTITLLGLIYIPKRLRLWEPNMDLDDENSQLLKSMSGFKRRRAKKQ